MSDIEADAQGDKHSRLPRLHKAAELDAVESLGSGFGWYWDPATEEYGQLEDDSYPHDSNDHGLDMGYMEDEDYDE